MELKVVDRASPPKKRTLEHAHNLRDLGMKGGSLEKFLPSQGEELGRWTHRSSAQITRQYPQHRRGAELPKSKERKFIEALLSERIRLDLKIRELQHQLERETRARLAIENERSQLVHGVLAPEEEDVAVFGEPIRSRTTQLRIVGRRRIMPLLSPEDLAE